MKIKLAATCFVIGSLLIPVAAYADEREADRTQPMTFVKDSVITTKVKAKLANEKMSSLKNINVDTDSQGVVVLSGLVKTQEEADKAVATARDTEGVTSVRNNIFVK